MLGAGATEIRRANYASKGIYFQAFTSLSTGLERIGKLCLMLDFYIDNQAVFPDASFMKKEIGHNLELIYDKSLPIIEKRSISLRSIQKLNDPVHKAIITILSEFGRGDRYSNINIVVKDKRQNDPVASWFQHVDQPLYQKYVPQKKKDQIELNAKLIDSALGQFSWVLHTSETGKEVDGLEEASRMTGVWEAVAPFRQLYVLHVIRFWVEFLRELQYLAMGMGKAEIPYFNEIFVLFSNDDSYFKSRKTWTKL